MKLELPVSPSSINSFFTCPYRWKLEREGAPSIPVDTAERDFGRNIHEIIHTYFIKVSDYPEPTEMREKLNESINEVLEERWKKRIGLVKQIFENFLQEEIKRLRRSEIYKPQMLEEKLENEKWRGVIDFYCNGEVIDWKTYGTSSFITHNHIRQGKIYETLLRSKGYEVKGVYFFSLAQGSFIPCPRVSDEWLEGEFERMKQMVESDTFPRGTGCKYCEYALKCKNEGRKLWEGILWCSPFRS